ncbi:MAG: hypothetical protein H6746_19705 [Deltaproteobacteria bacterium]|nr:hypothetical protein [Deltaproteobacteria bacterium]
MARSAVWCVGLVGLALVVACGGGRKKGGGEGDVQADAADDVRADDGLDAPDGDPWTNEALHALAEAWCPELAAAVCEASAACGCNDVPGFDAAPPADCLRRARAGCETELRAFQAAASAGLLEVAESVPSGCAPALAKVLAVCGVPDETFVVSCLLVRPPGLTSFPGADEPCADSLCAEGLRCGSDDLCAVPGAASDACDGDADCGLGLHCAEGACAADDLTAAGTACTGSGECAGQTDCLASTRRLCRAPVQGGACQGDSECAAGQFCDGGDCQPAPGLDQPCGNGVACQPGLACGFSGKGGGPTEGEGLCRPLPQNGAPCALGEQGPFVCAEGLACLEGTCGPAPGDGQACAVGAIRCAEGLGCHYEGEASVCRPRLDAGGECQLDDSCQSGLFCDFSQLRCEPYYAANAACSAGNECGPQGACVPDADQRFRCVPRPGLGDPCFLPECRDGLLCASPYEAGTCAPKLCARYAF